MAKRNGRSGRKLVIVSLEYLPPHISGNGVYAEQIVKALSDNWDIRVITAYQDGPLPYWVIPIPLTKKQVADNRFEFALKTLMTLKELEDYSPDIVLGVDWCSAPLSIVLSEKARCPLIWMPFRIFSHSGEKGIPRKLENLISLNAKAILTVSQADAYLVEKFFGRNAAYIYPPLTWKGRVTSRRDNFILTVSRVSREKNLEALIKALPLISKKYSLVVAGGISEESYLEELKTLAEHLGVQERITFRGRVSRNRLKKLYSSASIYVSTAKYEPFGLSIIEAAYHRLPIIMDSSSLVGAGELFINGKSCIRVNVDSRLELAKAVNEMLLNPAQSRLLGEEGKKIAEELTFEAFKDKFNNFIFSMVDR